LNGGFNSTDLGFATNTSLILFEVFSNRTTSVKSGVVQSSLEPHQLRLFVVGTNANRLVLPPYASSLVPPDVATSSVILPNVQFAQAGVYQVQVANKFGSVLSSNAVLTVSARPAFLPSISWSISPSATRLSLRWPAGQNELVLQATAEPLNAAATWTPVSTPAMLTNNEWHVDLPLTGAAMFYRLSHP